MGFGYGRGGPRPRFASTRLVLVLILLRGLGCAARELALGCSFVLPSLLLFVACACRPIPLGSISSVVNLECHRSLTRRALISHWIALYRRPFETLPVLLSAHRALPKTTLDSDAKLRGVAQPAGRRSAFSKEARDGTRRSQVLQYTKGIRLHPAERRRQGRVRSHFRSRARGNEQPARGAEAHLRRGERARQAGSRESQERLSSAR